MNELANNLSQYATSEVVTVLAALATAWIGWKAASKSVGVAKSIAKKATFMGLASTIMLVSGLGVGGLGIGEIMSRQDSPNGGISNIQLQELVSNESVSGKELKSIIEYVNHRDKQNSLSNQQIMDLAKSTDSQQLTAILAYISDRDKVNDKQEYIPVSFSDEVKDKVEIAPTSDEIKNSESIMTLPYAWMTALAGIGLTLGGVTCFSCRNNKRNVDDPHHPDYA